MGHNRNCHSLEALRITQKTSTREEKFLVGKKRASTSCVEADRLNRVLFFSVLDSRSAPYGSGELPRCVLCTILRFGTTLNFGKLDCFSCNFHDHENLRIKDIAYFSTEKEKESSGSRRFFLFCDIMRFSIVRDLYMLSFSFHRDIR